jgi:predicted DNA-binding transcriptional regulator AlpA
MRGIIGPSLDSLRLQKTTEPSVVRTPLPSPIETPLTAQELSRVVPLHPVTILRWAREGRIPHRRLSARKIVFLPSEIRAWLSTGYAGEAVCAA